jgi:hypothetical protein
MQDAGLVAYMPEQRGRLTQIFVLWGAPLAWFVELNVGYLLGAAPCFLGDHRLLAPSASLTWTHAALMAVLALCVVSAFLSLWMAWTGLRATSVHTGRGASRERFVAHWAVALGVGFALATLASALGFVVLPRCGG